MATQLKFHSDDLGKFLVRIAVGSLLLFHGYFKLTHGIDWLTGMLQHKGLPGFLAYGTYVAELLAPILLIIGLWTRLAALVIAVDLLMAIALTSGVNFLKVKEMGGGLGVEVEALFMICSLGIFFMGGGRFSLSRSKWS